jgi:hypothetical protein
VAGRFRQGPSHRLGGFHRQILDGLGHHPIGLVRREGATNDLELLLHQVGHDLGHFLPAPTAKELLLGRVAVAKGDRESQPLKLG